MNKLLIIGVLGLMLISCVSAYICIHPQEDNPAVQDFKSYINYLSLKQDIEDNHLTEEGLRLKLKYFGPCNNG